MNFEDLNIDLFDYVLVQDNPVNEGVIDKLMGSGGTDTRAISTIVGPQADKGAYSGYLNYQDPKLFASWSFGKQPQNSLNNIGTGYSTEVSDFGRYVVVKAIYSNPPTGKQASKTFLIVFDVDGSKGNIFQTSNRYRTFSGVSQASSYIRSVVSSLKNLTN